MQSVAEREEEGADAGATRAAYAHFSIYGMFIFFCALGIPAIYFGAELGSYTQEDWTTGNCTVIRVQRSRDDYPTCRTLYRIMINNVASPLSALGCASVNAHQPWGEVGSHRSLPDCNSIDARPWRDGPLLPAAWKCTLADQYETDNVWTLPYNAPCIYQCLSDMPCVALMDQTAPFVDWYNYWAYTGTVIGAGLFLFGVTVILVFAYVYTFNAIVSPALLLLPTLATPLLGWSLGAVLQHEMVHQLLFYVTLSIVVVLGIQTYHQFHSSHRALFWLQILFNLGMSIHLAVLCTLDIHFLANCVFWFLYSALLVLVEITMYHEQSMQ